MDVVELTEEEVALVAGGGEMQNGRPGDMLTPP